MTRKDAWRVLAVCLALGLGTIALYLPTLHFNFVNFDDELYVLGNPHVNRGLAGVFGWAFQTGYGNVWQPLVWISHALDCQLYGLNPGGHHATNLILHALNSALVFLALRQLTGAFWRSAVVAAIFAWHPLQVEPAAWVAERKGLLCAFFWLLTLWAYARYAEKSKARLPQAKSYYAAALVLFALALLSKPVAVTLPVLLLLLDWWPMGRLSATPERPAAKQALSVLVEKIPFFVLSAAACVMTLVAIHGNRVTDPLARLPFRLRLTTSGMACFHYLAKSFWPWDLGTMYPVTLHPPRLELIGVALALLAITAAAVRAVKTRPYWLAGWFWFLVTLLPMLNLVQTGAQPLADSYMYLPSIGLWMLVCWEAYDLAAPSRQGRVVLGGLSALVLVTCCTASALQLRYWKNEGTLLSRIPQSKSNAYGHAEYAEYFLRRGQLPQAQAECAKAISIAPAFPAYPVVMGDILLAEGKADEAIEKFKLALRLGHNSSIARVDLGRAFLAKKRVSDAGEEFKTVLRDEPQNFAAHHWLARTYLLQGRSADAAAELRASLKLQINQPDTLNELAWLLATDPRAEIRRGGEAVQLAGLACKMTQGREPVFLGTLAAAFAEAGDFHAAEEAGNRAHDLALAQGRKALADRNLQLVALYRAHQPYRERQ